MPAAFYPLTQLGPSPAEAGAVTRSAWWTVGRWEWVPDATLWSALASFEATVDPSTEGEVRFLVAETIGAATPTVSEAVPFSGPTGPIRLSYFHLLADVPSTVLA